MEKRRAGKERYRNDIENLNLVAFPLILQFITNYILGLTDQAIIGRISTEAYGAVGVINSFHYLSKEIQGLAALRISALSGLTDAELLYMIEKAE